MRIGLVDVDGRNFPNLALMKLCAWHKAQGDSVEWADPMFGDYDKVYMSKVFTYTPDIPDIYNCEVIKGGTGYGSFAELPTEIDRMQPEYSLYPSIGHKFAYGFLTRGCVNKCPWCIVPKKEGHIRPYMSVEEIAVNGRYKLILMDNNILACDYGIEQIENLIKLGYHVDFNQAMDARLVTEEIARMLSQVKWIKNIRFGCDTPQQIVECKRAMDLINKYANRPMEYLLYTIINDNIRESVSRVSAFKGDKHVVVVAQPFRNFNDPNQIIPQWQKDLALWATNHIIYKACDFNDFSPRKGFKCSAYLKQI